MVRRFEQRTVEADVLQRILDAGRHGPTAGFSQGIEFLVLEEPADVAGFWRITEDSQFRWNSDQIEAGPTVLVLLFADKRAYLARYSEPDKASLGMGDEAGWPVGYWDVDAGMAAMLMLLAAVDEGLGGWFFGFSHGERHLLETLGVPDGPRPIGVVGLGYRAADDVPSGSATMRPRRPFDDVVHRGRW